MAAANHGLRHRLKDQDGPEIIDIGIRGPGDEQIIQRLEVAIGVIAVEVALHVQPLCLRARQGVGPDAGTGVVLYTIDAIGDVVVENAGEGTDSISSAITYTLGANFDTDWARSTPDCRASMPIRARPRPK